MNSQRFLHLDCRLCSSSIMLSKQNELKKQRKTRYTSFKGKKWAQDGEKNLKQINWFFWIIENEHQDWRNGIKHKVVEEGKGFESRIAIIKEKAKKVRKQDQSGSEEEKKYENQ